MIKHPWHETIIHHFLLTLKECRDIIELVDPKNNDVWKKFTKSLSFSYANHVTTIHWKFPKNGLIKLSHSQLRYYSRGDTSTTASATKRNQMLVSQTDSIHTKNKKIIQQAILASATKAGIDTSLLRTVASFVFDTSTLRRYITEENLAYHWVKSAHVSHINVDTMMSSPTAPELRLIIQKLGGIKGKTLLDVGCGLGEASVYFAKLGARVTALDISVHMIQTTKLLAKQNHIIVKTIQGSVEHLPMPPKRQYDIIYAGNLFHHVSIDTALDELIKRLKPDGMLVCWEPVHYNPVINIYRKIASHVRAADERPLRLSDIKTFKHKFHLVEIQWFWLTTLIIFVIMAIVQGRNPNKERYWKAVVKEGNTWKWMYFPLERIDRMLISMFPLLGPLCWNVVLICTKPRLQTISTKNVS